MYLSSKIYMQKYEFKMYIIPYYLLNIHHFLHILFSSVFFSCHIFSVQNGFLLYISVFNFKEDYAGPFKHWKWDKKKSNLMSNYTFFFYYNKTTWRTSSAPMKPVSNGYLAYLFKCVGYLQRRLCNLSCVGICIAQ